MDAHVHFWDPTQLEYFWLTPNAAPLYRAFLPGEIEPELHASGVSRVVFVQASHDPRETAWALALAQRFGWIAAAIGWVDLESPGVDAKLEHFLTDTRFKGVRHPLHTEADTAWLARPAVRRGLAALETKRLLFELVIRPEQLPLVAQTVARHPQLSFVLDHLGNPPVEDNHFKTCCVIGLPAREFTVCDGYFEFPLAEIALSCLELSYTG